MARADGDRNSLSPLVLIGGCLIVASLTFGGAYLWLGQSSSHQLVVIKAPTTPVRVAPEDPGGLKLNSIDSPVMDLLVEQANQDEKNAEVLVPSESEPELPPIDVTPKTLKMILLKTIMMTAIKCKQPLKLHLKQNRLIKNSLIQNLQRLNLL